MYRNKLCDCSQCKQVDSIDEIQKGIYKIEEGIKDIQRGLELICCCRIREGIKCIEQGLCEVVKGLDDVIDALKDFEFECDYRSNEAIKAGVCGLKDGIKGVQEGLCELQNCCLCEGIESVKEGLKDLQEGLCTLVKGVNDVIDERNSRRKHKCYEVSPSYDDKFDEIKGCLKPRC